MVYACLPASAACVLSNSKPVRSTGEKDPMLGDPKRPIVPAGGSSIVPDGGSIIVPAGGSSNRGALLLLLLVLLLALHTSRACLFSFVRSTLCVYCCVALCTYCMLGVLTVCNVLLEHQEQLLSLPVAVVGGI